jgi:predicted kinase
MTKCYQLVGVPGSGKSTWVKNQEWAKECTYVSTDMWVEMEAERLGLTYNEVFKDYMPHAVKLMAIQVENARELGRDIIWDQTSTTVKSRKKKFNMLPKYEHIAIVFHTPARDELDVRLSGRFGKHIPKNVVDSMIAGWEEPSLEEGFNEVRVVGSALKLFGECNG